MKGRDASELAFVESTLSKDAGVILTATCVAGPSATSQLRALARAGHAQRIEAGEHDLFEHDENVLGVSPNAGKPWCCL